MPVFVLYDKETSLPLKYGVTQEFVDAVNSAGGVIPRYEYLEQVQVLPPDFDPRHYHLEQVSEGRHPTEAKYLINFDAVGNDDESVIYEIDNLERLANADLMPPEDTLKNLLRAVALLMRRVQGAALSDKEKALQEEILAVGAKVWNNADIAKAKRDAVRAGQRPDLDDLWIRS